MNDSWTPFDMPILKGKRVIVTGANSGIGFEAARGFAEKGAEVILACRNLDKAARALARIEARHAGAQVHVLHLDLADLSSVRAFADMYISRFSSVDVLVNNAGVMALPFGKTADGFEMQFGVNHLGHFALTGLLLPALLAAPGARIVTVSSVAHRIGDIDFNDLNWRRNYSKWPAYGQSKLANLLFSNELARRVETAGVDLLSAACHPGYANTNLQFVGADMMGAMWVRGVMSLGNRLLAQSAEQGAWPTLFAATSATVRGGDFIGPSGILELVGPPVRQRPNAKALDARKARRLWEASEELTQVRFTALESKSPSSLD